LAPRRAVAVSHGAILDRGVTLANILANGPSRTHRQIIEESGKRDRQEKRESTVRKDTHQVANSAQAVADDPDSRRPISGCPFGE